MFISVLIALAATRVAAQSGRITIHPEVRASAGEQLTLAEQLRGRISGAIDEEARAYAVGFAAATAQAVQGKWPDDHEAVFASHLLVAAIFEEGRWIRNAEEELQRSRGVAKRLGREALVDARLSSIYLRLNDEKRARQAAADAVAVDALKSLDAMQQASVLQKAALVFADLGLHRDAADCFTRATKLNALSPFRRTELAVAAAKHHRKAGDRVAARNEAGRARRFLSEARAQGRKGDAGFEAFESLERAIAAFEAE
ncbi:MAG TPA: hypothetical protein VF911_18270 [Thermoanaerobaculia bacterium]|jgi:hypothetical protein